MFDYLETFYNPRRRHSAIGQISPAACENATKKALRQDHVRRNQVSAKAVNSRVGIDHEIEFESSMEDLDWLRSWAS